MSSVRVVSPVKSQGCTKWLWMACQRWKDGNSVSRCRGNGRPENLVIQRLIKVKGLEAGADSLFDFSRCRSRASEQIIRPMGGDDRAS